MNRDWIIFISFALHFILFAFILIRFLRSKAPCPKCFERIPKGIIENNLRCPKCGELAEQFDEFVSPRTTENICRTCNESGEALVKLWDGHCYCDSCIQDKAPALINHIEQPEYVEVLETKARDLALNNLRWYGWGILGFAILVGLIFGIAEGIGMALGGFIIVLVLGSFVSLLFTFASVAGGKRLNYTATVRDGKLYIRVMNTILSSDLEKCYWRDGNLSEMTIWKGAITSLKGPTLLVGIKPEKFGKHQVAVGFTPETRQIWKEFFELAGIPEKPTRKQLRQRKKLAEKNAEPSALSPQS